MEKRPVPDDSHADTIHFFPFSVSQDQILDDPQRFRSVFPVGQKKPANRVIPRVTDDPWATRHEFPMIVGSATFRGRGMVGVEVLSECAFFLGHQLNRSPRQPVWPSPNDPHKSPSRPGPIRYELPRGHRAVHPQRVVSWHVDDALFSGIFPWDAEVAEWAAEQAAIHG
ncbi:leucine-rich repeat protein [Perkinsela sp. CCAP 1560/4]|nr:leucine-rich repeat protein [Perkinsela sp. CCAP 1560/4]|eukprot:KNH07300.1 leucine-rich repeat protein [Perkinsela sp. CCAP 1560/4]